MTSLSTNGTPTWVLLEGTSDVAAIRALRNARGVVAEEDPCILIAMSGATNIRHHLAEAAAHPEPVHVLGLSDEREAPYFVRALARYGPPLGLPHVASPEELPRAGFHVCHRDLEDELIRALGLDGTLAVLEGLDLGRTFEGFTGQQAWRGRPLLDQLRRFLGTTSGRKELVAEAFSAALPPDAVPEPLAALVDAMPVVADSLTE